MSPTWNPAFDLGVGMLLLYLWVKRRQRPYWQGLLGLPPMLLLLLSLGAWVPGESAWLFPWITAAKLLAALALLALWTWLFVRIRWDVRSDLPYLLAGLLCLVLAYVLSRLPALPPPVAELQAQNSVLILLALLVLGFLQRQCLYQPVGPDCGNRSADVAASGAVLLGLLPASAREDVGAATLLPVDAPSAAQRYLSPGAE